MNSNWLLAEVPCTNAANVALEAFLERLCMNWKDSPLLSKRVRAAA